MQIGYCYFQNDKEMRATKKKSSFIDRLKRIGPKMDPCGTPEIIVSS